MTLTPKPIKRKILAPKGFTKGSGGLKRAVKRRKMRSKAGKGVKTISRLVKDLDKVFSLYVRLSYADQNGMVKCFTCDKIFHYKKIHNGHYVSRFYKSVRWDKDNCRPQCMWCNMFKNGDAANYRERLVLEIGEQRVKELEASRKITQKLDREKLQEMISHYTSLLSV